MGYYAIQATFTFFNSKRVRGVWLLDFVMFVCFHQNPLFFFTFLQTHASLIAVLLASQS